MADAIVGGIASQLLVQKKSENIGEGEGMTKPFPMVTALTAPVHGTVKLGTRHEGKAEAPRGPTAVLPDGVAEG
jgi:hypothetical protein